MLLDHKKGLKMTITMIDCENTILREIPFKKTTRKSIAKTIALAIRSDEDKEDLIDWSKIYDACVKKWSVSGYEYILKLAHSGRCFK